MTRIAFYAPIKAADHPTPSGDREMARKFIKLFQNAGYNLDIASDLRLFEGRGDAERQQHLRDLATAEIERLTAKYHENPPQLWFTYHCYYKAPDLIGPAIADSLNIPYVIAEASRAKKRLTGPWAGFARDAERAIDRADTVLAMTAHDRFALERDAPQGQRIALFPPFVDAGPDPMPKARENTARLLCVAMMRGDDKFASYRLLSKALSHLTGPSWTLDIVGDGPRRAEVEALFSDFGDRVRFIGRIDDTRRLRKMYETADAMIWPGVNEAYGLVYLEAQAAGTPVIAQDHPGPRSVVGEGSALVQDLSPEAFARAIRDVLADENAPDAARASVMARHTTASAAARLQQEIGRLL